MFIFSLYINSCANVISYQITKPIKEAKMHSESVSNLTLFYYTLGDQKNPPLVFLHGILAFTEAYKRLLLLLSENFFIIGIDLPGHGRSSIPIDTYDLNDMSTDVIRLTDKLNLEKFYLVGHSMGGLITLSICEKFPEKIIKASSIASLYNVKGLDFENNKYDFLTEKGFRENNENHQNYFLTIFNHAYDRINEGEKFMNTKKILEEYKEDLYPQISSKQLGKIETPILVVLAGKDQLINPEHTREMSNLLGNGTLLTFPKANHGSVVGSKTNTRRLSRKIYTYFNQ